jgi:DNA invertase Pin-like site-specific DNA recombinase
MVICIVLWPMRAGMRRARLEGRHMGPKPVAVDREAILGDRRRGLSLDQLSRTYGVSRTTIHRDLNQSYDAPVQAAWGLFHKFSENRQSKPQKTNGRIEAIQPL